MREIALPGWIQEWVGMMVPLGRVLLIVMIAIILQTLVRRLVKRVRVHYDLPQELESGTRRVVGFLIYSAALLLILERLGVSSSVLWTTLTGFVAVAAVAFFAAWSVLSNIFCAILIFSTRPFKLHDQIEILENGEKPGLKGRVIDINLIYTTLQEPGDSEANTVLQVPNNLFFQRTVRRFRGNSHSLHLPDSRKETKEAEPPQIIVE